MRGKYELALCAVATVALLLSATACGRVRVRRVTDGQGAAGTIGTESSATAKAWVGSWQSGPSMSTARSGHAAVALADGRALVCGGLADDGASTSSAETYDAVDNEWEPAAPMSRPRAQHTATVLPSGLVLVVGGDDYSSTADPETYPSARAQQPTSELYDPETGEWRDTVTAPLQPRFDHTATLLPDGRVFVVGGHEDGASAEFFDPSTETWSAATEGDVAPDGWHGAALLSDGRVLITGGWDDVWGPNPAKTFDPTKDTWDVTRMMDGKRLMHSTTALNDGRVLAAGGAGNETVKGASRLAETYDPKTSRWTACPSMRYERSMHEATLLSSGHVLVSGGSIRKGFESIADAEVFDPTTSTWTEQPPMSTPRLHHTATLMPDGTVMVAGGTDGRVGGPYRVQETIEFYLPPGTP